jgi:lipopolysaccharide export system protein LptA
MHRLFVILATIILCISSIYGQSNRKILYRADMGYYDEEAFPGAQRLIGNVKFKQDNIIGYCDSAYLYEADNYIIAFGSPVRFVISDSINLYGARATYDGNIRQASISGKVRLENGKSFLLSDSLFYDLNIDCGYYTTGGEIYNEEDTLTSLIGKYYTNTDDAYLHEDVLLRSSKYTMSCDSLRYNANSKIAYFISPTHLVSEENNIYTENGFYNTQTDITILYGNVQLLGDKQQLFADSLYYDKVRHFGRAWYNARYIDTSNNIILQGNYLEHYEKGGTSIATDSNLLLYIDDNKDTLYLHCDTLKVDIDTAGNPTLVRAYFHTKFHHKDLQGACDSMVYNVQDSTLTMYYNPVFWADNYQLTGDTVRFVLLDSIHSTIELCKSGFIVGGLFEDTEFNQIKGLKIKGYIEHKNLQQVDIVGNAECVYYIQEEDSTLIGVNTSITSEMRIYLDSNKIQQIRYFDSPNGKVLPDEQMTEKDRKLIGFRWLDIYRPRKPEEVFVMPVPTSDIDH